MVLRRAVAIRTFCPPAAGLQNNLIRAANASGLDRIRVPLHAGGVNWALTPTET